MNIGFLLASLVSHAGGAFPYRSETMLPSTPDPLPTFEASSTRLKTGDSLSLTCRSAVYFPAVLISATYLNANFSDVIDGPLRRSLGFTTRRLSYPSCGKRCGSVTVSIASFAPKHAGLYRCTNSMTDLVTIMWINATLTVTSAIVSKNDYGQPVEIACGNGALPADAPYTRDVTWSITNRDHLDDDIAACCADGYQFEKTVTAPGAAKLRILRYDAVRNGGQYTCRMLIGNTPFSMVASGTVQSEVRVVMTASSGCCKSAVRQDGHVAEALYGATFVLRCTVYGFPKPETMQLTWNGAPVGSSSSYVAGCCFEIVLTIDNATEAINGSYVCQASQKATEGFHGATDSVSVIVAAVEQLSASDDESTSTANEALNKSAVIAIIGVAVTTVVAIVIIVVVWKHKRNNLRNSERANPPRRNLLQHNDNDRDRDSRPLRGGDRSTVAQE